MEKFNAFDPGMINNGIGCYIEPTVCCRRCGLPPPGAGVLVTPLAARRRSGPRSGDGGGGGSRTSLQMGASIKTTLVKPKWRTIIIIAREMKWRHSRNQLFTDTILNNQIPCHCKLDTDSKVRIFTHAGCHITGVCDGDNRDAEYKLMFCLRQRTGAPPVAWSQSRMLEY